MRRLTLFLCCSLLAAGYVVAADKHPLEVALQVIGSEKPTSFPKLLYLHVSNPGYAPVDLGKLIRGSELIIDGKSSLRIPKPFLGLQGLPPQGEWDGCLSFDEYTPAITPGKHKVSLKLGSMQSSEIRVRWDALVPWQQGNMKSRMKEIQRFVLSLEDGLPQSCVERWLPRKDGGQQEEDKIRYVLEPQFKIAIPYRQMYQPSGMHSVVDGTPVIYQEQALHD